MPVPSSIAALSTTPTSNSPQPSENVGTIMNQYLQAAYAFIAQINQNLTNNYNPNGTLTAPTGTRVVMQQSSAPAGWTVDTSANFTDAAVRFNQGVGIGGTTSWSGWNYGNTFTTSSTAISVAQMPAHAHGVNDPGHAHGASVGDGGHGHGVNDPGHSHSVPGNNLGNGGGGPQFLASQPGTTYNQGTSGSGTGISIQASGSNISVGIAGAATGISTQNNGSSQGHTHTYSSPQVKYADVIVAVKS